jgi:hypothetical protein
LPWSPPWPAIAALLRARSVASRDDSGTPSSRCVDDEEDASRLGGAQERRALLAANVIGRRTQAAWVQDSFLGLLNVDAVPSKVVGIVIVPVEQGSALIPKSIYHRSNSGRGLLKRHHARTWPAALGCFGPILAAGSDMPRPTHSFQASRPAPGYAEAGQLKDYPQSHVRLHLVKRLGR